MTVKMVEDDLRCSDSRAIAELQTLRHHFWKCSAKHLGASIGTMSIGGADNSDAKMMAWSEAYKWAFDDVTAAIKRLGHEPEPVDRTVLNRAVPI